MHGCSISAVVFGNTQMDNMELEASLAGAALNCPDNLFRTNLRSGRVVNTGVLWNIFFTVLLINTQLVAISAAFSWAVVTLLE